MEQTNETKKLFVLIVMIMSIINIVLIVKLFFYDIVWEIYTISSIIVAVIQLIPVVISVRILKRHININKEKYLKIISIVILLITFFIPVKTDIKRPSSGVDGLTASVMPEKSKQNLYNITIWSSYN